MKSYTDIEQSKKLAKILPIESADMGWYYSRDPQAARNQMWAGTKAENADIPCWSLAALLGVLNSIDGWYPGIDSQINGNMWQICMFSYETGSDINTAAINKELVDTCYEVILKLHERKML